MTYTIHWSRRAGKAYKKLQPPLQTRVRDKIESLADDPRPPGCESLQGSSFFRVRVGDYRIIYDIQDGILRVLVIHIGHRREIYDRLRNL